MLLCSAFAAEQSAASIIFKPNAKARYESSAEEEMNGNAQQLFQAGQEAENSGNIGPATRAYRAVYRRYPKDALAAGAVFRVAELQERNRDYLKAADTYRLLVEQYPRSGLDGRERGFELVRQHLEEFVFGAVGLDRLQAC
jgi:TolA-binding protein